MNQIMNFLFGGKKKMMSAQEYLEAVDAARSIQGQAQAQGQSPACPQAPPPVTQPPPLPMAQTPPPIAQPVPPPVTQAPAPSVAQTPPPVMQQPAPGPAMPQSPQPSARKAPRQQPAPAVAAALGDLWSMDMQSFGKQADSWSVVRAAAAGKAFIEHRLLSPENRETPIAGNDQFEREMRKNIEDIQSTGIVVDKDTIVRQAVLAITAGTPARRILTIARLVDFAEKNLAILAAYAKKDWKALFAAASECSAYTYKEFPEPRLCLFYASITVRCPAKVETSKLGREWNYFGYASWSLGFEEAEARARKELQRHGFESWINGWPAVGRFVGDKGIIPPQNLEYQGQLKDMLPELQKVFGPDHAPHIVEALSTSQGSQEIPLLEILGLT